MGAGAELPAVRRRRLGALRPDDWTQAHDLAAEQPEKLAELQRLFLIEAAKYNVLPLDDRRVERFNSDLAGRPQLIQGNTQLLFGGMGRLTENSVLNLKNKSHAVTAEIEVPDGGASGVIIAQGGAFGGWSLYLTDGKPAYCYNLFGLQRFKVYGDDADPGRRRTRCGWSSPTTAAGSARAAPSRSTSTATKVGEGRVERHRADGVLGRRDLRRRLRHRHAGQRRLQAREQQFTGTVNWVHRHRRRRPRPPHHRRGTTADRHDEAVTLPTIAPSRDSSVCL